MSQELTQNQGVNKSAKKSKMMAEVYDAFSYLNQEMIGSISELTSHFWSKKYGIKLISVETQPGIFLKGNNYFVSQANVSKKESISLRISETACLLFFDFAFGQSNLIGASFKLNNMTELEGNILGKYSSMLFEKIKTKLIPVHEINKFASDELKDVLHLGFVIYDIVNPDYEAGKLIISIPQKIIKKNYMEPAENFGFDVADFNKAKAEIDIYVGSSKLSLNDVKNLDVEDIVVLDRSNINKMKARGDYRFEFRVNPSPKLVIKIKKPGEGDEEDMNDIAEEKNMWDNIQIDVGAEFKKVKMSLGELRQMSEGLVIDLAEVYNNEITLSVENKAVAKGELVIIGDKYAVRIVEMVQNFKDAKELESSAAQDEEEIDDASDTSDDDEEDQEFDLSDFEIDDDEI